MISTNSPINNIIMNSVFNVYKDSYPLEKSFFWFSSCGGGSGDLPLFLSSYISNSKFGNVKKFPVYEIVIPRISQNSISSIDCGLFEMYFWDQLYSNSIDLNVLKLFSENDFIDIILINSNLVRIFGFRMIADFRKSLFFDYQNPVVFDFNYDYYLDNDGYYNLDIFINKGLKTIDNFVLGVGINGIVKNGIYNLYIYD